MPDTERDPRPRTPGGLSTGRGGIKGAAGVVGALAFGALCCGGAPIALAVIGGVGLGGVLGGLLGAVLVGAGLVALLLVRRARRARGQQRHQRCAPPAASDRRSADRLGAP